MPPQTTNESELSKKGLWNDEDGFFYDKLSVPDGQRLPLKVRSLVGLIPLLAMETSERICHPQSLPTLVAWLAVRLSGPGCP